MPITFDLPLLGFVAYSGTGKTTLLERLIPLLTASGLRLAVIKHAHHDFDIDYPGKDSYRLRKAGAAQMLVASGRRWALVTEHRQRPEPDLAELLGHLDRDNADLVLVEGFKHEAYPKIVLERGALARPPLWPQTPDAIAVAADIALADCPLPRLDLNDVEAIARFVLARVIPRTQ